MTLSTLITKSATMMVFTADQSLSLAWMLACPSSSSGASSFTPIHSSSGRADELEVRQCQQLQRKEDQDDAQHDGAERCPK